MVDYVCYVCGHTECVVIRCKTHCGRCRSITEVCCEGSQQ